MLSRRGFFKSMLAAAMIAVGTRLDMFTPAKPPSFEQCRAYAHEWVTMVDRSFIQKHPLLELLARRDIA